MQVESNIKPNKFNIENLGNGKSTVSFYDNIVKQEVTQLDSEETTIKYVYDLYKIEIYNRENLQEEIERRFESWLEFAKDCEYEQLAANIRAKRNKLLEETDKEMCIDRLNLNLPTELSTTTLLAGVKQFFNAFSAVFNGKMAKYRQELRDITKQPEFPYNVVFPQKPNINESEE